MICFLEVTSLYLMLTVYGLLAMPVLLRGYLRRHFRLDGSARGVLSSLVGLLVCGLTCSLLFFLATNFVTWCVTPWYPRSVAGLMHCYTNAIPFFRYTAASDLLFAGVFFGSFALLQAIAARRTAVLTAQA